MRDMQEEDSINQLKDLEEEVKEQVAEAFKNEHFDYDLLNRINKIVEEASPIYRDDMFNMNMIVGNIFLHLEGIANEKLKELKGDKE